MYGRQKNWHQLLPLISPRYAHPQLHAQNRSQHALGYLRLTCIRWRTERIVVESTAWLIWGGRLAVGTEGPRKGMKTLGLIFEDLRRTGVMESITIMPIWGGFVFGLSLSGDSKPANFLEIGLSEKSDSSWDPPPL